MDAHFHSTSSPSVYAAGDAFGGPLPLTPVVALEAHAVVDNLLHDKHVTGHPQRRVLARVRLFEAEAKARGLHYKVSHASVSGLVHRASCRPAPGLPRSVS